jgi:hypothetical protein
LSLRQETQAVILRLISGILSPNDSRNAVAADERGIAETKMAYGGSIL